MSSASSARVRDEPEIKMSECLLTDPQEGLPHTRSLQSTDNTFTCPSHSSLLYREQSYVAPPTHPPPNDLNRHASSELNYSRASPFTAKAAPGSASSAMAVMRLMSSSRGKVDPALSSSAKMRPAVRAA